ncbi:MAG: LacI family transcriptional regulator [Ruminococcaceae bacterium]|nr:LacI family transcriptional regulator [Oscillospiraceae bacterium]
MKKITLKDIARELNVTVGTVSHVFNGRDDISEEMRTKVLETAKKMGYISNNAAASLRLGKTKTVAIIVPDISNPHIAYQIKLIEDKISELGYSVIILNTNESDKEEYKAIVTACSRQVDGIFLCPSQHSTENVTFLNNMEIPYLLIGRSFESFDADYVHADDKKGGYLAGKYLVSKGCKNPLYVGAYSRINASVNRLEGIKEAFREKGIEVRSIETSPKCEDAESVLKDALEDGQFYDAIIAFSDLIAFKIISLVDKSVRVVGFDAVNRHLYMPFPYVSVGMKGNGWADKAVDILMEKINGSKNTYRELIDVELFRFNKR